MAARRHSLFDREIMTQAAFDSIKKLNPRSMAKNPVMFVAEVAAVITTIVGLIFGEGSEPLAFTLQVTLWLWFTVLFANFAEALAEGRGKAQAGALPEVESAVRTVSQKGGTPLVVADSKRVLGVVHLKDIVKGGLKDRFERFRTMGIKTVMITGDNQLTAAAIAKEAGVDDFLAEARPEDKLALIRKEQASGRLVAMTGDGT